MDTIQANQGAEFRTSFHWHVLDKGINHVDNKPQPLHLNGKVERSRRINAEECRRFLEFLTIDVAGLFNTKLQERVHYYNCDRPHGTLGGQTLYKRLRLNTQAPT